MPHAPPCCSSHKSTCMTLFYTLNSPMLSPTCSTPVHLSAVSCQVPGVEDLTLKAPPGFLMQPLCPYPLTGNYDPIPYCQVGSSGCFESGDDVHCVLPGSPPTHWLDPPHSQQSVHLNLGVM